MHDEVLQTDRFPEMVYECSRLTGSANGDRYWVALSGELTLHGVTRRMPISARIVVNGDSLRATGDFAVGQTGYHITLVSAAAGTMRGEGRTKVQVRHRGTQARLSSLSARLAPQSCSLPLSRSP